MIYEEESSGFRSTFEYNEKGIVTNRRTEYFTSDNKLVPVR